MKPQCRAILLNFRVSSSRLRHRPAPVFPQQIVARLDHQGLDGRIPVKGEP
jgi:hypothetical protein